MSRWVQDGALSTVAVMGDGCQNCQTNEGDSEDVNALQM